MYWLIIKRQLNINNMKRLKINADSIFNAVNNDNFQDDFIKLKAFLSWSGLVIIGFGLLVVVGNYIFSTLQPFRGPSKIYFWLFIFIATFSLKAAIWLIIFSLSLMPNFHHQLAYLTNPSVKYFIVYPGVDAIAGLFFGQQLNYIYKYKKFNLSLIKPPWEMGLLLVFLTISTIIAVIRNIWQTASHFTISNLIDNVFNFKLIDKLSDYLPISDLLVFIYGVILAISIINYLDDKNNKNELIVKPLIISLFISAFWGIVQAWTSYGLNSDTLSIRHEFLGYGAIGFQPDIHSYGSLMMLGAVGLIGFVQSSLTTVWRHISIFVSVLCWVALVLSKSRASLGLTILMTIFFIFLYIKKSNIKYFIGILIISTTSLIVYIVKNTWFRELYKNFFYNRPEFYEAINTLSSWRYDLHSAAVHMWSQFPLFGIGLGNLYRTSADYAFSSSTLMSRLGGENAHNYFLQLLVEVGLIGFICFSLIIVSPFLKIKNINILNIGSMLVISLFLGNIYSHSMIIRENMYLLVVFISLLYSFCNCNLNLNKNTRFKKILVWISAVIVSVLILVLCSMEIINKWNQLPFEFGRECYRVIPSVGSGWDRNRLTIYLPDNSHGVRLTLSKNTDSVNLVDLSLRLDLFDKLKNIIATNFSTNLDGDYLIVEITLPEEARIGAEGGVAVLTLLGCSVDKDLDTDPSKRTNPIKLVSSDIF